MLRVRMLQFYLPCQETSYAKHQIYEKDRACKQEEKVGEMNKADNRRERE